MDRAMAEQRVPPHNLDAERAILGSMLLANETIPLVMEQLEKASFYNTAHQIIYEASTDLNDNGDTVDLTTLTDVLKTQEKLEAVGGPGYLASLEQYVLSPSNISQYIAIVRDKAQLRRLIQTAATIMDEAHEQKESTVEILTRSEQSIFEIAEGSVDRDFRKTSELIVQAINEISSRYKSKKEITGVPTGYKDLDVLTSGFQPSDLIIIAGRPSAGKTAFALNITSYVAVHTERPVGIFSLEMSAEQLSTRLLCALARVPSHRVRSGYVNVTELERIGEFGKKLSTLPIFISDSPGMSVLEVRAKARRLKAQCPDLALIVIDYLQLMHSRTDGMRRIDNRQQEVSEISRSLKALARELKVPVIALSQLSRLIEYRRGRDRRPMLSDLRESGAIEQDSDVVLFIHRPRDEGTDEEEPARDQIQGVECEIIIGKQRNGPLADVKLLFFPDLTLFSSPSFRKE